MPNLIEQGNSFLAVQPPVLEITGIWLNPNSSNSSNLLAKVTVTNHRCGQTVVDCSVVRTKSNGFFVFPPAAPMVGRDGTVMKDQVGKSQFKPLVVWTKDAGRRFSEAVVKLLKARNPELFGGAQ